MKWRHVPALDGLRGLAVLAVVGVHLFPTRLRGGFLGVDVFFVLSGFLITGLLMAEREQTGRLDRRRFYLRRALRLWAALLAVIVLAVGLTAATGSNQHQTRIGLTVPLVAFYVGNWWQGLTGVGLGWLAHTWSLAIEEQFYLVWPFVLVWLLRKRRPELVLVVLIAASVVARAVTFLLIGGEGLDDIPFFRADALLLGGLVALLIHQGRRLRVPLPVLVLAVVGLLGCMVKARGGAGYLYVGGFTLVAGATAVIVAALATGSASALAAPLSWSPLRAIGRVSYGIYLYHYPIVLAVDDHASGAARVLLVVALTGAVTVLSWWLVETPFLRMKDRLGASAAELGDLGRREVANQP